MDRRSFLKAVGKICAGIPIIGTLAATGQAGASEGKPLTATEILENGSGMWQMNEKELAKLCNTVPQERPELTEDMLVDAFNEMEARDEELCKMLVDAYNEMGRPISPMAQLRRELKKYNFPREHIKD